jgi:uncharacterized protein
MGVVRDRQAILYRPRLADAELQNLLQATGAVVLEGPRAVGKTETARRAAASEVRFDVDDAGRAAALIDPGIPLVGPRPRLIDEWQLVPGVWNRVRRAVDEAGGSAGQFILTGSAVPADDSTRDSGAMRIGRLRLRPMSLSESGHSTSAVSLAAMLHGEPPSAPDPGQSLPDLVDRIVIGGWPALLDRTPSQVQQVLRAYLEETSRLDLPRVDGVRRDPANVLRVIRSLARHTATPASSRSIASDVGGAEGPVDHHTVLEYVRALARVFLVDDVDAWSPALRSRSQLRSAPIRHLADPSLAAAALDATTEKLLRDVRTLGLLFESLVIRDLRIYARTFDAGVFHYRDNTGLEADAVIERRDGTWAAFEVKLGLAAVDGAASNLLRLAARVDQARHGPPAALGVITGSGPSYRRPDGVAVISIGTLAP